MYVFDNVFYTVTDTLHYGAGEVFNTSINPEPRVAAMYRIDEQSSVKASYSRTAQYAQVASAATGGLPFDVWFPTSPNVKPQKCDQFAVGYFRNFNDDAIETSVELYYKDMKNVIDFKDNAITYGYLLIDGELRVGKGRSYGAEFLVRKNVGKFTGWISYTYSRSFRTIEGISQGKEYRSPYDRPHNLVLVANYDVSPRISLAANWIYNTGQPVTFPYGQYTINGVTYAVYNGKRNESRYPDYHRLDLVFVIYPFGKRRQNQLKANEYLGVRFSQLTKMFACESFEKLVAMQPVTFAEKADFELHQCMRAIDGNVLISRLDPKACAAPDEILLPAERLRTTYALYPQLIENAEGILDN